MKVLATIRPKEGVDFERDLSPLVPGEVAEAWRLYKEGVVRELYATADGPGAVLVMECEGAAEARGILGRLPEVSAGLAGAEVVPLAPYAYFEVLFREGWRGPGG